MLALLLSGTAYSELPEACTTDCIQTYGVTLGESYSGVPAYSNCQSACVVPEPNKLNGTFTGIKWQCVEYARRWLLVNKGLVYGDVDFAIDIWDSIHFFTRVSTGERVRLESRVNGSDQPPVRGDLLIYARTLYGTGHVAVVIAIDLESGTVEVGEQNYSNEPWPDKYSRKLDLIRRDGKFWLLDPYLIGWKTQSESEPEGETASPADKTVSKSSSSQ